MPGDETVSHIWRRRRQKGGTHPASASAGFVLLPCHGVRLCLAERGGQHLGSCCWLQISMAITLDGHRRDWVIHSPWTSMADYPNSKYLAVCWLVCPYLHPAEVGPFFWREGTCGFFHPGLCHLLTFCSFFFFFFFLKSGPEVLSKKDISDALFF